MRQYKINEIYYTIQGEGYYTGTPAVFVRFSSCNLACPWCDTNHLSGDLMTAGEIVKKVTSLWPSRTENPVVVLTGGEPALQTDDELIQALHAIKAFIAIETNGTREIPEGIDWVTCSPKPDSSLRIKYADEVKVVFDGKTDPELWRKEIQAQNWFLQPLDNGKSANISENVEYILTHPSWHLSLQTHKMIGIK